MKSQTLATKYQAELKQYRREDGSVSYFAIMGEVWFWCLQTLTSLGYGVPWAPIAYAGCRLGAAPMPPPPPRGLRCEDACRYQQPRGESRGVRGLVRGVGTKVADLRHLARKSG